MLLILWLFERDVIFGRDKSSAAEVPNGKSGKILEFRKVG